MTGDVDVLDVVYFIHAQLVKVTKEYTRFLMKRAETVITATSTLPNTEIIRKASYYRGVMSCIKNTATMFPMKKL